MSAPAKQTPQRDVYSISRLNREARTLLESAFAMLWVEGEISNLAKPSSGHLYFTLKDARAQVSCALFRNRSQQLGFNPEEGMQVVARARVSLYEPRGGYQLIIEHMEEAGDGALRRAFEALKQRLSAEGLFDAEQKTPIPEFPNRIGIITSPGGAAIRDVVTVLQRRFPATQVIIYPTLVQGEGAARQIVRALRTAESRAECDVLLLTRGGGSLEDLWPFNEESVARAVYECRLPIISAIGHEIDFVITDFVADLRAPTPSAAAELLSPDAQEWQLALQQLQNRLSSKIRQYLQRRQEQLKWFIHRLRQQHPGQRLLQQNQRLDELEQRLRLITAHRLQHLDSRLHALTAQLLQHTPRHRLLQMDQQRQQLTNRLLTTMSVYMERYRQQLKTLGRALDTVSPLATLQRGYSITLNAADSQVLQRASDVSIGDSLETRLSHGYIFSKVTGTKSK